MRDYFLRQVADNEKNNPNGGKYYYKWVGGWAIAQLLSLPSSVIRKELVKMEKTGLVIRYRHSSRNCICWALTVIEGFEPYKFEDYFCRTGYKEQE